MSTKQKRLSLVEIARAVNVNPKVARDRFRKAAKKPAFASSNKRDRYNFLPKDKAAVVAIVKH